VILSDTDILKRLPDLDVKAADANFPFDAEKQVQPCSIDLRLDRTIWMPTLGAVLFGTIDLSNQTPLGPEITGAFKKEKIESPKGLLLRPRQFVLGRTYESF
jgi:deoxycytidine triphosphate deaminase